MKVKRTQLVPMSYQYFEVIHRNTIQNTYNNNLIRCQVHIKYLYKNILNTAQSAN